MRFKKFSAIFEYTAWLLKKYNEQKSIQLNHFYRLAEAKQSADGQYHLLIQVIGKASTFECKPQDIVADDRLLEGFSKKDIRTITYFACSHLKKPKYKIVMQEFCEKFNRVLFRVKGQASDEAMVKTAGQIAVDKNLINNLSREDVQSVSYMAGYEHSSFEKEEMKKAKD